MADFKLFEPILLDQEGFWANKPNDSGGQTWRGISRNNYPKWKGWVIVDFYKTQPDFPYNMRSDKPLQALVDSFYECEEWDALRLDEVKNQSIANFLADWAVNAGHSVPIKHTQHILALDEDGIIGSKTINSINTITDAGNGFNLFHSLQMERAQFYIDVVKAKPQNKQFLDGWLKRNLSFKYLN